MVIEQQRKIANLRSKGHMSKPLTKALRTIVEGSLDRAIANRTGIRTDAEERLQRIQGEEQVATEDLVALFRCVLALQQQAEFICADRYNLVRY